MNAIESHVTSPILEDNNNPDDIPQELDYWAVEDFEDLFSECAG